MEKMDFLGIKDKLRQIRKTLRLTQKEFADGLGISQQAYSTYESRGSKINVDILALLMKKYKVNPDWFLFNEGEMFYDMFSDPVSKKINRALFVEDSFNSGKNGVILSPRDVVRLPVINIKASAGSGIENFSWEKVGHFYMMRDLIEPYSIENISVIRVSGDSMVSTLFDGDYIVFVQGLIDGDSVYVINAGGELRIKRLQFFLDGRISVISDNKNYPPEELSPEDMEHRAIYIVGRVIKRIGSV